MQNRLGALIGRRKMTEGANLDRQMVTLADIFGGVALLAPGRAGREAQRQNPG